MRARETLLRAWFLAAVLTSTLASESRAGTYAVPSVDYPTMEDALAALEGNVDATNTIEIVASPLFTAASLHITAAIGPGTLTIRPGPALSRAFVVSTNGTVPVFLVDGVLTGVTIADLDIIRNTTNNSDLVKVLWSHNIDIERCRIGSIWSTGVPGWANLRIDYPFDVVVRNCIFFSHTPGIFDRGIHACSFPDPANSVFLYNNDVADYRLNGIFVDDENGNPGALLVVRNNVVVNHPDAPAASEPRCFRTDVNDIEVVKSGNAVFATDDEHAEVAGIAGAISLSGLDNPPGTGYLRFVRPLIDVSVATRTWDLLPAWDPNPDFFRLDHDGPLHDMPAKWGTNVANGLPHDEDVALHDDVERDWRPGGTVLHTDRGADQIEAGLATGVNDLVPDAPRILWAAPERNPARSPAVRFRTAQSGTIDVEVFDVAGRSVFQARRTVSAGESALVGWPVSLSGVFHYRVALRSDSGAAQEVRGKLVILR